MRNFSSINTIKGHLGTDPQLRHTTNGEAIVELFVLSNRRVFNRDSNEWEAAPATRHTCKAFGQLATNIADTLTKGTAVLIVGETHTEAWADRNTGEERTRDVVMIRAIGPDLTRAIAQVTRNPKTDTSEEQ